MEAFKIFGRIVIDGAAQAQEQLQGLNQYIIDNKAAFRTAGVAMTAFGGAVIGTLGLVTKAAIEQKESIARLTVGLKNIGIEYDNVKTDIEELISAQTQKTNYSDNEQLDALQQLVLITGDYGLALEALPTALDLAAAKHIDLSSAAVMLGKGMIGITDALSRYGIEIPKDVSASKVLEAILVKVKGTAEATANPFIILKNQLGELAESVGSTILPVITGLVDKITSVIDWLKQWTEAHPELTRYILIFAGTLGTLALGIGPLLIMLPSLANGLRLVTTAFLGAEAAAGPVGWAIIGISIALAAAMPFLLTATTKTKEMTEAMKEAAREMALIELETKVGAYRFDQLTKGGEITAGQFHQIAWEADMTTRELAALMDQADLLADSLTKAGDTNIYLKEAVRGTTEATEDNTNAVEDNVDALKEQEEAQNDLNQAASDAIGLYMDEFRDAHDERMRAIDDEYNATIAGINAQLEATLAGYNSEIDALNDQIRAIDEGEQQKKDDVTRAQLEAAVKYAATDKKRIAAQKELDDFLHKQDVENQKDEIRTRIDTISQLEDAARNKARNDEARARREYETEQRKLNDEYDANIEYLETNRGLYDTALTEQTDRYKADLAAFKQLLLDKLPAAQEFVGSLNSIYAQIRSTEAGGAGVCGGNYGEAPTAPSSPYSPALPADFDPIDYMTEHPDEFRWFQHGGLISEPTVLTRLRDMRPYGIAGEAGAERVSPLNSQMMTIIMEMDGRQLMRTLMPYAIGEIRMKTGLKA